MYLETIIVSGLPRSGTSMMMQMLEAGGIELLTDGVRGADEDNIRGYYELEAVKHTRADSSWLHKSAGKAVKVIHILLPDLPVNRRYRVILMRRSFEGILASQAAMLERSGREGSSLPPDRLAKALERQMHNTRSFLEDHSSFEFIEVEYEEVIADPVGQAEQINQFLGGGLDVQSMAAVVDPSLCRH
ncbi:MAG: sulfotransferase domain-containing protein [Pirellulales bacterium]|nr:sulfotransferase domain-containing protein [Pirellulales bacterium]